MSQRRPLVARKDSSIRRRVLTLKRATERLPSERLFGLAARTKRSARTIAADIEATTKSGGDAKIVTSHLNSGTKLWLLFAQQARRDLRGRNDTLIVRVCVCAANACSGGGGTTQSVPTLAAQTHNVRGEQKLAANSRRRL